MVIKDHVPAAYRWETNRNFVLMLAAIFIIVIAIVVL